MSLSESEVRYVAKLGALELTESEVPKMQKELNSILEYIAQLSAVSSVGVIPTSHVHGVTNFFREDTIKDSIPVEDVGSNAPDFSNGFFLVPKII